MAKIVFAVIAILVFLAVCVFSCPSNCVPYNGNCACEATPERATAAPLAPNVVSNERPPSDKMPSYQREGIHADMPPSTAFADAKLDAEKADAEAEGKAKAGIK